MKRDTVINILLIMVGILLALALFGAGAMWKGGMHPSRPSVSAPPAGNDRSLARKKLNPEESGRCVPSPLAVLTCPRQKPRR